MPREVIYFQEYYYKNSVGDMFSPMIDREINRWSMGGIEMSFDEVADLCKIPEDERIVIKLTYSAR